MCVIWCNIKKRNHKNHQSSANSTLDTAVDVAAMIGEWSVIISLIGACVIGFCLVLIGIVLIFKRKSGRGAFL